MLRVFCLFLLFPIYALATPNQKLYDLLGEEYIYTHKDKDYQPASMLKAFRKACEENNVTLLSLEVDDSEFPPLIVAKTANKKVALGTICKSLPKKYSHNGSVTSPGVYCLDIIPLKAQPGVWRIHHRKQLRMRIHWNKLVGLDK